MPAWDKDENLILLMDPDTGAWDTALKTVEVYPIEESYPTGKINCTQLASLFVYKPDSDLDADTDYWVRVGGGGGTNKKKWPAKNRTSQIGI